LSRSKSRFGWRPGRLFVAREKLRFLAFHPPEQNYVK